MNLINQRQNEIRSIELLAAQRTTYSNAKLLLGIHAILAIPVIILLNTLIKSYILIKFNIDLTNWIAIFSLTLTFTDILWLRTKVTQLQEKGAIIQEEFDRYVYQLNWDSILIGEKTSDHEIKKQSIKYLKSKKIDSLRNWYSIEVSNHDEKKGILLCQSENLGWDIELRTSYVFYVSLFILVYIVSVLITAILNNINLNSFILSYIIPSMPIITYFRGIYLEQCRAINSKKTLKQSLDHALIQKKISKNIILSIQLQIYNNRKSNPLIFDWFNYIKFKKLQKLITDVTRSV